MHARADGNSLPVTPHCDSVRQMPSESDDVYLQYQTTSDAGITQASLLSLTIAGRASRAFCPLPVQSAHDEKRQFDIFNERFRTLDLRFFPRQRLAC
jgi:hypothetical protein